VTRTNHTRPVDSRSILARPARKLRNSEGSNPALSRLHPVFSQPYYYITKRVSNKPGLEVGFDINLEEVSIHLEHLEPLVHRLQEKARVNVLVRYNLPVIHTQVPLELWLFRADKMPTVQPEQQNWAGCHPTCKCCPVNELGSVCGCHQVPRQRSYRRKSGRNLEAQAQR
jgi:hypothetical protein